MPSNIPKPAGKKQRRQNLSVKKKLLFASILLLVFVPPALLAAEISYRIYKGIPLTGGRLYENDLRIAEGALKDQPWNARFLSRFRKSDNSVLFYEPRPGYDDGLYAVNSHGFRDREFSFEKGDGVFRIVTLGDSIIWGHGLPLESTFAKQLERILNARFGERDFEVLNFGVSGYSTVQEVEMYRYRAARFSPDLIIMGYCLNDYYDSSVEGQAFQQLYYDIYSKSYLFDAVKSRFNNLVYERLKFSGEEDNHRKHLQSQFQLLQSYSPNADRVLVIFPTLQDFDNYPASLEHRWPTEAAHELDYAVLDLLEFYRPYEAESLILNPDDVTHPNALGTQIAVEATIDLLVERGLIPAGKNE